jgi:hypothetical protein
MSESPGSFIRNRANLRRDSAKLRLKRHPHAREWPATSVTGICSFQKCKSITRSPERPNVPSKSRTSLDSRLSWARKMQSGLWLYSNTPSRRRNQLSRAKTNSAQMAVLLQAKSQCDAWNTRGAAPRVVLEESYVHGRRSDESILHKRARTAARNPNGTSLIPGASPASPAAVLSPPAATPRPRCRAA